MQHCGLLQCLSVKSCVMDVDMIDALRCVDGDSYGNFHELKDLSPFSWRCGLSIHLSVGLFAFGWESV